MFKISILICIFIFPMILVAKEDKKSVDYMALAALLLKGEDFQRAEEALKKVNLNRKGIDLSRYYTIKGLINLRSQEYDSARESFLKALEYGQKDKSLYLYLAQAYYGLAEYEKVLKALEKSEAYWSDKPRVWLLKSLSYWAIQDFDQAMSVILNAETRFPNEKQFSQRKVFFLIELGLYQAAVQVGLEILEFENVEVNYQAIDFQSIGKAMIEAGQYSHALPILEKAVLKFPDDLKLIRTLSRVYVLQNKYFAAATILERAAAQEGDLLSEVAELYRKSNWSEQALYFNQISLDQKAKYKQRLAIFLHDARFDDAISMKDTLYRVGLLDDGNIRYALAYAFFSVGQYQQAEEYLDGIRQASLFRKATQLRKAMLLCENSPSQC